MKNKTTVSVITAVLLALTVGQAKAGNTITLTSPNQKTEVTVSIDQTISYSIIHGGEQILSPSTINMELSGGIVLGSRPRLTSKKTKAHTETISSPFHRVPSFEISYQETVLTFSGGYGVTFRVYNEGVAYRFQTSMKKEIEVINEEAVFAFPNDNNSWLAHTTNTKEPFAMAFQNTYNIAPLSKANTPPAFLPATIEVAGNKKITILESDLESYPGMFLQADGSTSLRGVFAKLPAETGKYSWRAQEYITKRAGSIARTRGTRNFPWRILAISEEDTEMPVNNLVYALASPNRIGDYNWVVPGRASWEWWNDWGIYGVDFKAGINMETYKYHIDFASRYGLEYIILDEGWYDPKSGDMLTVIPELNLPELVAYGKSKGVKLILWTVFNVLNEQLEAACSYYSKLGIAGFKIDFLDRDDQAAVDMTYRIAEATARHQLVLNLHGFYKPTGLNRTFPHIINFEGVFGMEEAKWSTVEKDMPLYDVTFPFIRMMAGPVDFTPGAMRNATKRDFKPIYNNPMSQGTRCHQLAMYIVYDSPLTMFCDAPTYYEKEDAYTRFLASIPVQVDHTQVLDGKMGEFIVTARRKQDTWFVAGMTNWTARTVSVDFSFLPAGKHYTAILMMDGVNAEKQAADYDCREIEVNSGSRLKIPMASGGGFAIRIKESPGETSKPSAVPASLSIHAFYKKYLDANGIPIVSSGNVRNEALMRARKVITQMLSKRPDVKAYMVKKGCKLMIVGEKEEVCDIPEYAHICDTPENITYWNKRARGFGGSPEHDFSASCGEENIPGLPGDRYKGESIMVHEFAHILHMVGIVGVHPQFNEELEAMRQNAIAKGLWKDTYCISNKEEYFAETVQSFFNCNQYVETANGVHNAINTRAKLKVYDPDMYQLLLKYLPEIDLDLVDSQRH